MLRDDADDEVTAVRDGVDVNGFRDGDEAEGRDGDWSGEVIFEEGSCEDLVLGGTEKGRMRKR